MRPHARLARLSGLVLLGLGLAMAPAPASAGDAYQPSVVANIEVTAENCIVEGANLAVKAKVSSDADGGGRSPRGDVRFEVDGKQVQVKRLDNNGTARVVVHKRELPRGRHTVRATYLPSAGSNYQRVSDSTTVQVRKSHAKCAGAGATTDQTDEGGGGGGGGGDNDSGGGGGFLPNTGGFWLGLLIIALLALAAGAALVRRSRATASASRTRSRTRPASA